MKKLILTLTLLFSATGCLNFEGTFTAGETLKLVHTTMFGNEKIRTVPVGSYTTSFSFSSEDKMKLEFQSPGDDITVKIKFPSNVDFPRERGEINLPATKTGQRYDILGYINTDYSESRVYRDTESCTYTDYRTECRTQCDSYGNCRQICQQVPYSRRGFQRVEYRYHYTDRQLDLELVKPGTNSMVADYSGTDQETRKDYLYRSMCR